MINSLNLRPKLGRLPHRRVGNRFLFVCFFDPNGVTTIYENIALWQEFSRYGIEILNLWPDTGALPAIPSTVDLDEYAGLIVHCTASYHPDNVYALDTRIARPFEQYDGIKILMKQDEHYHTNQFATYIGHKKFDLVVTCVSPKERQKVYPPEVVGNVHFLQAFTGYVSPFMRSLHFKPMTARPLDIAYRGSIQPLSFGRLGFEKRKIGYDVSRAAARHPLEIDISSRWQDRIGGTAWFDFLARSKAVLGVESGANLFDFTGEVEAWCRAFENKHSDSDHLSEEFYERAHRGYLHKFEGNVNYAQISPRHLEAAATRSVQVLYDGYYSGVFVPNRNFLPLRRDLKNLDEVVDFISDNKRMSEMAERTFEEIILNRELHYEAFVEHFDLAVDQVLARKGRRTAGTRISGRGAQNENRRALLLAAHEPTLDPRVEWMAAGLSADFEVCELGTYTDPSDCSGPGYEQLSDRRMRVRVRRDSHDWDIVPNILKMADGSSVGLQHLMLLYILAELPAKVLERSIGALDATEADLSRFRWLTRHFINTNCALLQAGRLIGEFDVIVAADMDTLPAALILAEECGATVLYDAHEFWPHAFLECRHWEIEFWSAFDRNLATNADLRVTVSPQLADLMSKEYGCEFLSVPNCASKKWVNTIDVEAAFQRLSERNEVLFIFLGGFGAGRGIENLIMAWSRVDKRARLLLQGPDGTFKTAMIELARSQGLLGDRIVFPQAVETSELVSAARQADVGIIPYAASSINNRYCCPNKLSQYMAAGLPIVCNNELEFVKSVVVGNNIGVAVDFRNHEELAHVIDKLAASKNEIYTLSRRSRQLFDTNFNWEAVSGSMYARLDASLLDNSISAGADLDFSWIDDGHEMRKSLAQELGDAAPLFADTRAERLDREFAQERGRLNAEVNYLRSEFASETERLINEANYLRSELVSETGRLVNEVERFRSASVGQLIVLCIRARLINLVKSLPPPILAPIRRVRSRLRQRHRGARPL